jgi:hypothetical protein
MGYSLIPLLMAGAASLSVTSIDLSKLQQLNQELGRLCSRPPQEAVRVCHIHSRLINRV